MRSAPSACSISGDRRQWLVSALRLLARPLPDAAYLHLAHWLYYRRWPDFAHPHSLQEHIQAYLLRSRDPRLVMLADTLDDGLLRRLLEDRTGLVRGEKPGEISGDGCGGDRHGSSS